MTARIVNSKLLRYLVVVPMLLAGLLALFFRFTIAEYNDALMRQKFLEKKLDVDLACNMVEQFIEADTVWNTRLYFESIKAHVEFLDDLDYVFCGAFNDQLELQTDRVVSVQGEAFDPLIYPEVYENIYAQETGEAVVSYDPKDDPIRDMYIYWRWVPTSKDRTERHLIIIAASSYSILVKVEQRIIWGVVATIFLVAVFSTLNCLLTVQLGYVAKQRKGSLHWKKETHRRNDD